MGFEYKLVTQLTVRHQQEITTLFENNNYFDKCIYFNNQKLFEFREPDNNGKMPNRTIIFETDGIYICQHGSSYLWRGLEDLKTHLEKEHINYTIIDYQD